MMTCGRTGIPESGAHRHRGIAPACRGGTSGPTQTVGLRHDDVSSSTRKWTSPPVELAAVTKPKVGKCSSARSSENQEGSRVDNSSRRYTREGAGSSRR